jgi:diguanylate cyclase (GGDEF)-like protein/PAS domain S-box-containing protein
MSALKLTLISLGVGILYYLGAYLGVTHASLPSGIPILWPPNAVLLAAMLSLPMRYWPYLAASALFAVVIAVTPFFTVFESVLLGLVGIGGCAFAAVLLRRLSPDGAPAPDWGEPWDLARFVLVVFFVVSPIAAVFGVSLYTLIILGGAPFASLWKIWWLGDATGLIALTPALHMLFNWRWHLSKADYRDVAYSEWVIWLALALATSYFVFALDVIPDEYLVLTPLLVLIAPIWAALRLGMLPTALLSAAIVCYAAVSTASGRGPFLRGTPEATTLLTQEALTLFTVIVLFTAVFVSQNHRKSKNLRLYRSAVEATGEGVLITEADNDQPIIYCNESFLTLTGYSQNEVMGQNCRFLNRLDPEQEQIKEIREAIAHREPLRITLRNFRRDGTVFWNNLIINPIRDHTGRTTHFVGIVSDISSEVLHQQQMGDLLVRIQYANENLEAKVRERTGELEEANQKLRHQALTDELTGVQNRRNLISRGHLEALRSSRSGRAFAVMLLDIDYFKLLNDQYGHDAGDQVLKTFADTVENSIRKIDSFGRWGGEEFLVIVGDADQTDLQVMGEKILERVAECSVVYQGQTLRVTASMGIARWADGSFDQLVSKADTALYRAKETGRNRLVMADESSDRATSGKNRT